MFTQDRHHEIGPRTYHVRRIKMDDHPNRGDIKWVLFASGHLDQPIVILSDFDMDFILAQVKEQNDAHK
jgi:hypothetical protein